MTLNTLYRIAEKNNYTVTYKRYHYWDNVLHINNTAICLDTKTEYGNGFSIRTTPEYFPAFVTQAYIKECIDQNMPCLGTIDNSKRHVFGGKVNIPVLEVA